MHGRRAARAGEEPYRLKRRRRPRSSAEKRTRIWPRISAMNVGGTLFRTISGRRAVDEAVLDYEHPAAGARATHHLHTWPRPLSESSIFSRTRRRRRWWT